MFEFNIDINNSADFKKIKIEKNSITLVVGKNNVGKTTLLKEIEKQCKKDQDKEVYFLDLNLKPFDPLSAPADINKVKGYDTSYSSYSLIKKYFEENFNEVAIIEEISKKLEELLDFNSKKNNFEQEAEFARFGLSLEINTSQILTVVKKPFVIKGNSIFNGEKHDIENMGLGNLRIAIFKMLYLILKKNREEKKEIILLIDEPEVFLHPNLIKEACSMLKLLVKDIKNITIILTTHSPYVISELKEYFLNIRNLYSIDKKICISNKLSKENIVNNFKDIYKEYNSKEIKESGDQIISRICSWINFDYSRIFFSDKIIAVEGLSDYLVFTSPIIFLELKKTIGDFDVVFFHGLNNLPLAYTVMEIFNKNFVCICDNDYKSSPKKQGSKENTTRVLNLINNNFSRIKLLEKGTLEDELKIKNILDSTTNNSKPANVLNQIEEIDKEENAKIIIKYLKELI